MTDHTPREKNVIIVSMIVRLILSAVAVGVCYYVQKSINSSFPAFECLIGISIGNIGYVTYDLVRIRRLSRGQSTKPPATSQEERK